MFSNPKYSKVSTQNTELDMAKMVFGRRNSFLAFYLDDFSDGSYGNSRLYAGSCSYLSGSGNRNRLLAIHAIHEGEEIPYSVCASPAALRIQSLFGYVEFCIAEKDLIRIRGEGITLRISAQPIGHESVKSRENGCFEMDFGGINEKYLFMPVSGSLQTLAPFDYKSFGAVYAQVDFQPPAGETIYEGAILQFCANAPIRRTFAPYEECVHKVEEDFKSWQSKLPAVPDKYQRSFKQAAYLLWSNVVKVGGNLKEEMISVDQMHVAMAYSWQQSYQAVAHSGDIQYAWRLLLSAFEHQDEAGQLAEAANDCISLYQTCKPPIQGLAIHWIMEHCDLSSITHEQYLDLYEPLGRWTDWWFTYRDRNGDGLPAYDHGDESGMDDTSLFRKGVPLSSPDLASYLSLQMDVLSRLAHILGKEQECCRWKERSDVLLQKLLEVYWDGEQFISRQGDNMETVVEAESLQCYVPLILGKRLPEYIRAKMLQRLQQKDKFITPFGFATEAMDSPHFELSNAWTRGTVNAPNQFIMILALTECGEQQLAGKMAIAYCDNVEKHGPHQHFNPFTGEPVAPFGFFQLHFQPWTSWASGVFMTLIKYCS